jgi:hypothetical protein
LIEDGWASVGWVVIFSGALDLAYQFFVLSSINLFATLIVAFVLAVVPYVIVRGIVTRIANALMTRAPTPAQKLDDPPPK